MWQCHRAVLYCERQWGWWAAHSNHLPDCRTDEDRRHCERLATGCTPCLETPCGQCVSGCPDLGSARSACLTTAGKKSTRNMCGCNNHNTTCPHDTWSKTHILCPPIPPPPQFQPNKAWQVYLTLGDASWAPGPNVSSFGFASGKCPDGTISCSGDTWTNGHVSTGHWPAMIQADRGPNGKPCAGTGSVQRGPSYTAQWTPSCKGSRIDTGTEYGALCCRAGG